MTDIRSIAAFLYERSLQGAAAWLDAYDAAQTHLGDFAEGCPVAIEDDEFDITR